MQKLLKNFAIAVTAAFAVIFALQAQPPQGPPRMTPEQQQAQAEAQQRGAAIYKQNCSVCHSADLTGGRGPDLIRSPLVRHDKDGDMISPVVTQGRIEKGMPAFPFSQAQVSDLIAFIDSELRLYDLHTRVPGAYPNDIPAARLETGSAEAGKAFFYGKGGCSTCHSPDGDLAHIASKYDPPDLEQRFLNPIGVPITATVTDSSGQKFEGVLLLNDDFHVTIHESDGWTRTWPRGEVKLEIHDPAAAHEALLPKWTDAEMHDMFSYLETLK